MRVEVLVAAMNQSDLSLAEKMGITGHAVIANQADRFDYQESGVGSAACIRMLTTPQRGVGRNRNLALLATDCDICIFADEDEVLAAGYLEMVVQAFREVPEADMLVFNIETMGPASRPRRANTEISRVRLWNALNYGACRLAVRRSSLERANVWFSLRFGGGAHHSAGEDSLFIADCLRARLRVFTYPKTLGYVTQTSSSWFSGYTEEYFRDKGVLYMAISPRYSRALCLQDAIRHRRVYSGDATWWSAYRRMREGTRGIGLDGLDE